jgi:outer membrane murein-binding lipoprotein Lpp
MKEEKTDDSVTVAAAGLLERIGAEAVMAGVELKDYGQTAQFKATVANIKVRAMRLASMFEEPEREDPIIGLNRRVDELNVSAKQIMSGIQAAFTEQNRINDKFQNWLRTIENKTEQLDTNFINGELRIWRFYLRRVKDLESKVESLERMMAARAKREVAEDV